MEKHLKAPFYYQLKYNLKCWLFLPITFLKRVVFGKDELAKRFFLDKWGFLPKKLVRLTTKRKAIWIITNSGGEVTQAASFFKKLKSIFPEYNLIISTESYDTFRYAQTLDGVDFVFFPPWDISIVCKLVLRKIRPSILIFIEHCYFPVLCKEAKELKIKALICSGMINYQLLEGYFLMQRTFALQFYKFMDRLAVKGKEDFDNLCNLGINPEQVSILGDMKFDLEQLLLSGDEKKKLKRDLGLLNDDLIFIVGSLHKGEVDLVLTAFRAVRKSYPGLKLILAPRWRADCQFIEAKSREYGYIFNRRSQLDPGASRSDYDVLIIDTFGELARLYGIASVVFIASSVVPINVRRLGHNIFEPLAHGVPVLFGPNMGLWRKFADSLKEVWPECEIKDSAGLTKALGKILSSENLKKELRDCSLRLTGSYGGITQGYIELVQSYMISSSEKIVCRVCQSRKYKFLLKCNGYNIYRCKNCNLLFTLPLPGKEELDNYYKRYLPNTQKLDYSDDYIKSCDYSMAEKLRVCSMLSSEKLKTFLDVGCGCGFYLNGARRLGLECHAVEKDLTALAFLREEVGISDIVKDVEELSNLKGYFDIIHFRQVIEHLSSPEDYLAKLNSLLRKGGILIIETPNSSSLEHIPRLLFLDAVKKLKTQMPQWSRSKRLIQSVIRPWKYVDPPRHLYGFNAHNLKILLEKCNFKAEKVYKTIISDKIYHPIPEKERQDIGKAHREAERRLRNRSLPVYAGYKLTIQPLLNLFKTYIKLSNNGNNLTIYAQKI